MVTVSRPSVRRSVIHAVVRGGAGDPRQPGVHAIDGALDDHQVAATGADIPVAVNLAEDIEDAGGEPTHDDGVTVAGGGEGTERGGQGAVQGHGGGLLHLMDGVTVYCGARVVRVPHE